MPEARDYTFFNERVLAAFQRKPTLTSEELSTVTGLPLEQVHSGIVTLRKNGFKIESLPDFTGYRFEPAKWRVYVSFEDEGQARAFAKEMAKIASVPVEVELDSPDAEKWLRRAKASAASSL